MAMETVPNYKCDRCGRSELRDDVTILTLTVRERAGKRVPGLGKADVSAHVCRENCLKIIENALTPVKVKKPATTVRRASSTKGGTKKAHKTVSRAKSASESVSSADIRLKAQQDVRATTRRADGHYAPGYYWKNERDMIAARVQELSAE